jgi:hypothetical protein
MKYLPLVFLLGACAPKGIPFGVMEGDNVKVYIVSPDAKFRSVEEAVGNAQKD